MSYQEISAVEAYEFVEGDAVLLDVRTPDEFDAGHAPMASLVPLAELPDRFGGFPHERLLVCICRSGQRSARAARFLHERGFDVANVAGGMESWSAHDLPMESDDDDPTVI